MKRVLLFFLMMLFVTGCKKSVQNNKTKMATDTYIQKLDIELSVTYNKELKGVITIDNQLNEPIKINSYVWKIASLILELEDMNGNAINMPPPPIPPSDLEDYEIEIASKQSIKLPISGINIIADKIDVNGVKARVSGEYKSAHAKNTEVKTFSDWVLLGNTIFDK